MAGQYVSNNVKTSLGPVGLDQDLVDAHRFLSRLRSWVYDPATKVYDISTNPVTACQAASKNIKTSLSPVRLDPMFTNDILGDIDAHRFLSRLRSWVYDPATKNRPEEGCEDKWLPKLKTQES